MQEQLSATTGQGDKAGGNPSLGMRTKLAFGVGSAAEAAVYIAFNAFNLLFYNNVLGLSGTLCGLAVSIALVFDAISDPLVGSISDRFHSRLGRRHPFMYASVLPLALCFAAVYAPPSGLGQVGLFLWLCLSTTLLRTAITLFTVPHLALGAELTSDYRERSVVMAYSVVFQVVGGASAAFIAWTWFAKAPGGTTERANFLPLGLWVAGISAIIIFISTHFTRDQVARLSKPKAGAGVGFGSFLKEIAACLRNREYRVLLFGLIAFGGTLGLRETLESYLMLFYWQLPGKSIRLFHLATPPAYILAFALVPRLHGRLDKRETIIAAVWGIVFAVAVPVLSRMMGVFPENGERALLPTLACFYALFYFSFATLMISVMSALADVADEHELETGRRQEGIFYSARTFFLKVTQGTGHLLAGMALDLIGFPEGAKPGEVAADAVYSLGVVAGPVAAIPAFVAVFFYARYAIDKRRHAETQALLVQRRLGAAVQGAE